MPSGVFECIQAPVSDDYLYTDPQYTVDNHCSSFEQTQWIETGWCRMALDTQESLTLYFNTAGHPSVAATKG